MKHDWERLMQLILRTAQMRWLQTTTNGGGAAACDQRRTEEAQQLAIKDERRRRLLIGEDATAFVARQPFDDGRWHVRRNADGEDLTKRLELLQMTTRLATETTIVDGRQRKWRRWLIEVSLGLLEEENGISTHPNTLFKEKKKIITPFIFLFPFSLPKNLRTLSPNKSPLTNLIK